MEGRRIRARIFERGLRVRHLIPIVAFVVAAPVSDVCAFSVVTTRGPGERTLGMERSTFSLAFETYSVGGDAVRWKLEAGEWTLFGVDGLTANAFAAEARWGGWGGIVCAGVLSSPVGTESVLSGTVLAAGHGRVRVGGGVGLETVALDGCSRVSALSVSLDAVVSVSPQLVMCSRAGGLGVAGAARPGADASLHVAAFPAGPVCGVVGVTVTRDGDVVCDVSSRIRLAQSVRAALGYDDGTGAITGALSVSVRTFVIETGASVHPVLGVSKALFVSWRRGVWK